MVNDDQVIDPSYVDVTGEEIIAAAAALDTAPPAQVLGGRPPQASMLESAIRVGTRSLRARGLLRTADEIDQIDQGIADCVTTAGSPERVVVVTSASSASQAVTWLYLDGERLVVMSTLEPGLLRLRLLPAESFGAALTIVAGLDEPHFTGSLDGFDLDLASVLQAVDDLPPDQRSPASPEATAAVHMALTGLNGDAVGVVGDLVGTVTTVAFLLPGPAGPQPALTTWLATDDGIWSRLALTDTAISGSPTTPSELLSELENLTSGSPPS